MSDQGIINLYINDLASTTHELYKAKADYDDLVTENVNLKSTNASLAGENSSLKTEIEQIQAKYDALKSGLGDAAPVIEGEIVPPAPETPPTPHF
jgi:predicted  nucleic acid-binding Zn-ribbon protein